MRTKLEEGILACTNQVGNRRCEKNCLANIIPPVFTVELLTIANSTGDGGNVRDLSRHRFDVSKRFKEFILDRLHLVRVKRVVDTQPSNEFAIFFEFTNNLFERLRITCQRKQSWTVHHSDLDLVHLIADHLFRFGLRNTDRYHATFSAGRVLETRTMINDLHRVFHRVGTSNISCGDLTNGVTDYFRRLDAPGFPKRGKRNLEAEDRGLSDVRAIDL